MATRKETSKRLPKAVGPDRRLIQALTAENLKLHRKVANLEAQLISARNGVIAEIEGKPLSQLTDNQLQYMLRKAEKELSRKRKRAI